RHALVMRYGNDDRRNEEVTARAQEFALWTVETTATGLDAYLTGVSSIPPTDAEKYKGTIFAKLLNKISDEFYFASGACDRPREKPEGLTTVTAKTDFLSDVAPILHRIADVGTPATIYHLIELLEFLIPADPPRVFDLVAHALLGAGKRHG